MFSALAPVTDIDRPARLVRSVPINGIRTRYSITSSTVARTYLIVARITELAWALKDNPYEGRETDEPNALLFLVPRLHYFIFYSIVGSEIHINHIRHTSRKRPPASIAS
jgi:plasmid stabilization system protein ParE